MEERRKHVVLSGIRATGKMHLGNYLGVLEQFAANSQDPTKTCLFFIADMHTLTTQKEAAVIRSQAPEIIRDMLAAGVDPDRAVIYIQSDVPQVAELAWYLACLTPVGQLSRMPTFKDKAAKQSDDVNAGLFFYPVLMAADILGPRADYVPIGRDQEPHLELAVELARRFNRLYPPAYFPIPEQLSGQGDETIMVPGLVAMDEENRFAKMGKSEASEATLYLNDPPSTNRKKILRAPTDPARVYRKDPGEPSRCAIFHLHTHLSTDVDLQWVANGCRAAGIGCAECKGRLAENFEARLASFWERRKELSAHPERVEEILQHGQEVATRLFTETTNEVARRMGVFRFR